MYKFITIEQAKGLSEPTDRNFNTFESAEILANEVNYFIPCKVMVLIYINPETLENFHRGYYAIVDKQTGMFVYKWDKKYKIESKYFENLTWFKYYDVSQYTKHLTVPNQIGVLSTKKLQDWLNYRNEAYKIMIEKDKVIQSKVTDFYKKIKGLPFTYWNINKENILIREGELKKNGLTYYFKVHPGGYIEEKIRIGNQSIDTFLTLTK